VKIAAVVACCYFLSVPLDVPGPCRAPVLTPPSPIHYKTSISPMNLNILGLQWRWTQRAPPKCQYLYSNLHSVVPKKNCNLRHMYGRGLEKTC